MYDVIHYRANSPARVLDCTSVPKTTLPRDIAGLFKPALDVGRMAATPIAPVIGALMPDGTVYAGVSPDTGKPMYTTPKDPEVCGDWDRATTFAAKLNAHGHKDWRVPSQGELHQLFTHKAAIGGFSGYGEPRRHSWGESRYHSWWYWSSMRHGRYEAWCQHFHDGAQSHYARPYTSSLRCVRG